MCATVNDKHFLPELGENRRYWVIPVTEVKRLEDIDLQQLWAQACHEYREGKRFWLEPDERKLLYRSNEIFERKPPIIQLLELHVRDPHDPQVPPPTPTMMRYLDVDDVPSATPAGPKPPVLIGEVLNVSQIYNRLTGRTEPNRSEILTSITDWLTDRNFRTATNRRFHVAFVDMPDEGRGNPFD